MNGDYVVLAATRGAANPNGAAGGIGRALTVVHLVGMPLSGTSVNPAQKRAGFFVSGDLSSQLWLFIVVLMVGAHVVVAHFRTLVGANGAASD